MNETAGLSTSTSKWVGRLGALAGVGFFVFLVASLTVGSSALTTLDVSGEAAVRDWAERHSELKLRVALVEVAAFFGLVFTVELKVRLDGWGAAREALLAFAGGLLLVGHSLHLVGSVQRWLPSTACVVTPRPRRRFCCSIGASVSG